MSFSSPRERRLWILAGLLLFGIYSTLYFVRGISNFLRDRNLLRVAVILVFLIAAGFALRAVLRHRPGRRAAVIMGVAGLSYLAAILWIERPEEKIHLVEYGLLGGLIYEALRERRRATGSPTLGLWTPAIPALLLTVAAGWLDEGIQKLLPNRYYDLRDVAFNAVAGLLAIGVLASLHRARSRETAPVSEAAALGIGREMP